MIVKYIHCDSIPRGIKYSMSSSRWTKDCFSSGNPEIFSVQIAMCCFLRCIDSISCIMLFLSFNYVLFYFTGKAKLLVPRDHSERIGTVCSALEESYKTGQVVKLK